MAPSNKKLSCHKQNSERDRTPSSMRESTQRALPAYLKRVPQKDVLSALGAIERDVTLGKPIRWKKLLPVVREMIVIFENKPDSLNFIKALLGLCERYHCRDISLLSEVFQALLIITDNDLIFLGDCEIEFEKIFFCPYGEGELHTKHLLVYKCLGETHVDLVWKAVRCANLGFLKLQLKFGMGMMLPYTSLCGFHIDTLLSSWPFPAISDEGIRELESTADYETLVENGRIIGFEITKICEEAIENNLSCNFNPESRKRLCLVLRTLEVILQIKLSRPDFTEHFIDCYRLLFDSIPAPFVTSIEVKTSLEKCLPASCSRLISRITENFKNILPELAEVPQPRSLKHLCRIEVRQSLRRNLNLPHGVTSLPLPTDLMQYIMLNDDGDYSVIINDSCRDDIRGEIYSRQELYISIPNRDDWVTSFIKKSLI